MYLSPLSVTLSLSLTFMTSFYRTIFLGTLLQYITEQFIIRFVRFLNSFYSKMSQISNTFYIGCLTRGELAVVGCYQNRR